MSGSGSSSSSCSTRLKSPIAAPDSTTAVRRSPCSCGVPGTDQPAHRMSDQHDRQVGPGGGRGVDHLVDVGDHVLEVLDQRPITATLAVADVIDPVDHRPVGDQRGGDVVVPPDVFAVAVHEHRDEARRRVRVGPRPRDDRHLRTIERPLVRPRPCCPLLGFVDRAILPRSDGAQPTNQASANGIEFVPMWARIGAARCCDRWRSQMKPRPATNVATNVPATLPHRLRSVGSTSE